jgi:hypothetical protein
MVRPMLQALAGPLGGRSRRRSSAHIASRLRRILRGDLFSGTEEVTPFVCPDTVHAVRAPQWSKDPEHLRRTRSDHAEYAVAAERPGFRLLRLSARRAVRRPFGQFRSAAGPCTDVVDHERPVAHSGRSGHDRRECAYQGNEPGQHDRPRAVPVEELPRLGQVALLEQPRVRLAEQVARVMLRNSPGR